MHTLAEGGEGGAGVGSEKAGVGGGVEGVGGGGGEKAKMDDGWC